MNKKNNYDIKTLAWSIVDYVKESDPYEFKDCYDSEEVAFNHTINDLEDKDKRETVIEWLCSEINYYATERDLTEQDTLKNYNKVTELLKEVNIYSNSLEYEKDDIEL